MLINFRFDNYRSFYEEANLSMQTTVDSTLSEINTFTVNEKAMGKGDNELLKSAVIFGGNASGKSNIMKAFAYMVNVVRLSSAQIPVIAGNEPFAFQLFYHLPQLPLARLFALCVDDILLPLAVFAAGRIFALPSIL